MPAGSPAPPPGCGELAALGGTTLADEDGPKVYISEVGISDVAIPEVDRFGAGLPGGGGAASPPGARPFAGLVSCA